jgi:2-methylcitrate dehydratase PrpD
VELVIGPQAYDVVGRDIPERRTPKTWVAAQFSVYWTVAVALVYGELTPRQLSEEIPPSPKILEVIARISAVADPGAGGRNIGGCTLRAYGSFGGREVQQTNAIGHPDHPLTDDELLAKFKANLRYANVAETQATDLAACIMAIDDMPDLRPLSDALAGAVES